MEIAAEGGPVRLAGPKKENKWRQNVKNGFSQEVLLQVVESYDHMSCLHGDSEDAIDWNFGIGKTHFCRYLSKFGYDIGHSDIADVLYDLYPDNLGEKPLTSRPAHTVTPYNQYSPCTIQPSVVDVL